MIKKHSLDNGLEIIMCRQPFDW